LWAVPALAQDEKGWVDVNVGVARAAEQTVVTAATRTVFRETAAFGVGYDLPRGASFDFGGGYMATPVLGVGISIQGTAHQGFPALSIRIPHPNVFNAFASDTRPGDQELKRVEGSVHFQAMVVATPNSKRLRVRVFGGPTYFRVEQDAVQRILYDQVFQVLGPINTVQITRYEFSKSEATGWGYHAGADVGVFFTRVVGVGGFAKFSRGTVTLSDISGPFDVKAGGFQAGGGLRLKF
jgi:hypothetical protein